MSELKSSYLDAKRRVIFANTKCIDFLLFLCLWFVVSAFLFPASSDASKISDQNDLPFYSAEQNITETIAVEISLMMVWAVALVFNILLIAAMRGTLGMKALGIRLSGEKDARPTFMQAIKLVLLSPLTFSLNLYFVFMLFYGLKPDLYVVTNAKIVVLLGTYAVFCSICMWKFGSTINTMENISGLDIRLSPKKLEKLEKKFDKKGKMSLYLTEKSMKIGHKLYKISVVFLLAVILYMSALVILDLPKKLEFEEKLYAPYAINWGKNNGFFALQGLVEPANISDSYEAGRSIAYQYFVKNEELKKKAKISYSFDIPPTEDFTAVDLKSEPLEFKFIWDEPNKKNFDCLSYMRDGLKKESCASFKELEETIKQNKVLWDRFNQLPNYTEFQRPPINLQGRPNGKILITLARMKSAQIIMMVERGQPEEALKEWARFMQFYRKTTEAQNSTVAKAIYMIVFGIHHKTLEKILYLHPELAVAHFDLIKDSLNPQGVAMFRGETMLMDDWPNVEVFLPSFGAGYSPGIRNKFYHCFMKLDGEANLSAKQFFSNDKKYIYCSHGNLVYDMLDWSFMTTGNAITNTIYGFMYSGLTKGQELVGNMHVADTYMRMEILGAKILHDKIPAEQIVDYIRNAPVELQNPIVELPFEWDEKGKCLYFLKPGDPHNIQKFHLNIK